jgi:hypothetical protein
MACQFAPNGNRSKLYDDLNSRLKNPGEALERWMTARTPEVKEKLGNWTGLSNELIPHEPGSAGWFGMLEAYNTTKAVDENGEPLMLLMGFKSKLDEQKIFKGTHLTFRY